MNMTALDPAFLPQHIVSKATVIPKVDSGHGSFLIRTA
jgi:hypothetical protein